MGVSGQHHALATFYPRGKKPPVPIGQLAGCAPEPVRTQRLEEKSFCLCWGSHLNHPSKIPHLLWNTKVHYHVYNSTSKLPILRYMKPVHNLTTSHSISLKQILILSFHLQQGFLSGLFPSDLPMRIIYAFLISPMHVACPTHLILLDLHLCLPFRFSNKNLLCISHLPMHAT
jgi:hypothetical protein